MIKTLRTWLKKINGSIFFHKNIATFSRNIKNKNQNQVRSHKQRKYFQYLSNKCILQITIELLYIFITNHKKKLSLLFFNFLLRLKSFSSFYNKSPDIFQLIGLFFKWLAISNNYNNINLSQNMFHQFRRTLSTSSNSDLNSMLTFNCYTLSKLPQIIPITLALRNDGLEIHRENKVMMFKLDKTVKFQILRGVPIKLNQGSSEIEEEIQTCAGINTGKPCGLRFYNLNFIEMIEFYFFNEDEIRHLIRLLQIKINQLNFLSEYKIIRKIKNRQKYTFYWGQDRQTKQKVLVKAYCKERMISECREFDFQQETLMMRGLLEENYLKFHIVFESLQAYYVVMEDKFINIFQKDSSIELKKKIQCLKLKNELKQQLQWFVDKEKQNLTSKKTIKKSRFLLSEHNNPRIQKQIFRTLIQI